MLAFYLTAPTCAVTLQQLEKILMERKYVLQQVDIMRRRRADDPSAATAAGIEKLRARMRLTDPEADNLSFFLTAMHFCATEERRGWFCTNERYMFQQRLAVATPIQVQELLTKHGNVRLVHGKRYRLRHVTLHSYEELKAKGSVATIAAIDELRDTHRASSKSAEPLIYFRMPSAFASAALLRGRQLTGRVSYALWTSRAKLLSYIATRYAFHHINNAYTNSQSVGAAASDTKFPMPTSAPPSAPTPKLESLSL